MKQFSLRLVAAFVSLVIIALPHLSAAQVYLDPNAPVEERVDDLLSRMNLDEKIGQMTQVDRGYVQDMQHITTYGLGSLLSGGGSAPAQNTPTGWADMYDNFQSYALQARLKIPMIYGIDAVHGHNNVKGAVIFPHNIGLGCTRNDSLVEAAQRITAIEVAGTGIDWTFAPCIAVPRDERWGRTYEGFAETAALTKRMAAASVAGFQGNSLADPSTILACAKHFVGDGGTTYGQDQGNVEVDEATLRAIHLPGYVAAIEQNVGSIMASYNSWQGQKIHSHAYLLTTLLKCELGFTGFVVSDWSAIDQIPGPYKTDVETSINAGIDMVMVPDKYIEFISTLKTLVEEGRITHARIDDAVRRILRIKFDLGLFEHPYTDRNLTGLIGSDEHRAVARECVRQSLVLLKKKDGVLPVRRDSERIHVAGKNADNLGHQCGGWTISWQGGSGDITEGTTILEGIRMAAPSSTVTYDREGLQAAGADLAIAVIGETPYAEGRGDRTDLGLSEDDIAVVRNMKRAGVPVVVILISGRPLILEPILHFSDVVIAAWLPGTEGGGVSDVLFGNDTPTGRLSHSWPREMSQVPINVGQEEYDPLFEYGHGLTSLADAPPGSTPEFYSSATSPDGAGIEVTFNKAMTQPAGDSNAFTVVVNDVEREVADLSLKENDSTTVVLRLTLPVAGGDVITIAYDSGTLTARDGGRLAAFGPQRVYNLVTETSFAFGVPGRIEAEGYQDMFGVQTQPTADAGAGLNVGWIDTGDWMDYRVNVHAGGVYALHYRVASASVAGQIRLMRGEETLVTTNFPVTGGWQNWTTVTQHVHLQKGVQTLRVFASSGGFNLNWFEFDLLTSVDENRERTPHEFGLLQNYPNPFNPSTTIVFELSRTSPVSLQIYNLAGEMVATLAEGVHLSGRHTLTWEAASFPSGVYVCRLKAGGQRFSQKLLLLK